MLITGGSRGIGRAIAYTLAGLGFDLLLWARDEDDLKAAATEAAAFGVDVRTAVVDVADPAAVAAEGASSLAGIQSLRAVVVNAGSGEWQPISELSPAQWRETVGVNLDGAFHTIALTVPLLRRHPHAQLIGIASDSSYFPFAGRAAYCASKAGLVALLDTARRELRADGVRVTSVAPSAVDSYFRGGRPDSQPGSRPDGLLPADVADVVGTVLTTPARVEIREIQLAAMTAPFGPYGETYRGG